MFEGLSGALSGVGSGAKELFNDPNFLQYLGTAGSKFAQGQPAGQALDPSGMIGQKTEQQAIGELLQGLLNPTKGTDLGSVGDVQQMLPTEESQRIGTMKGGLQTPTPLGSPGPDSVTTKQTDAGTTTTVVEPSEKNLSTYGTTTPPEAMMGGRDSGSASPFFKALLSQ